jgi:hypothetical protein
MLDKLIQTEQVTFTIGYPTALGFIILIILVVLAFIGWAIKK